MQVNELLNDGILAINNFLWGWPLIIFFVVVAGIISISLRFVQFRYFTTAWKLLLSPNDVQSGKKADMTPFQAFLNALSTSLGNGSLGGMATAIFSGGPGAAVWIFVFGLLGMAIRFCEVFLSTAFGVKHWGHSVVGGPMVYLSKIPGKTFLPYLYALFCLFLALTTGNAMQANTIRIGCARIFGVESLIVAAILLVFMLYVMLGGAKRIVAVSDAIVPLKVGVFFLSALAVLGYHYASIIPALILIFKAAFTPQAVFGGAVGYSIQHAIRFGIARTLNASEAGLGTAAVLFGGSASTQPTKDGIMSMLGSFISANLVCFSIALMLVASGVWNNGQTSLDLTISAYETVFGTSGGWIVTFLSISFGLGVLVSYAYIARSCWLFLTQGKGIMAINIIYCIATFLGALAKVDLIWNITDLINAILLVVNMMGIVLLLPIIKIGLYEYEKHTLNK
jgi:AGCS family alanine or glycine:cation symporter